MAKALVIPPVINQEYEYVAVDLLKFHPRNVRQGDVGEIYQSIEENGFYGACVVQRSTSYVLIGNHRLRAAIEALIPSVPVIWVDVDDERALRIMLSDNGTNDKADNDRTALAELLAELAKTQLGLAGTSFDGDDLDRLINDLAGGGGVDPNAEWQGMPGFVHEDKEAFRTLIVHFNDAAAVKEFSALIGQDFSDEAKYIYHPKQVRSDLQSQQYQSDEP